MDPKHGRFFRRLLGLALVLCLLATLFGALAITSFAAPELPPANSQPRHVVCTALSDAALAYYTGDYSFESLASLPGAANATDSYAVTQDNALYSALQTLMTETHNYKTSYSGTSAGSMAYYWARTDAVSGGSTYIMFYSDVDPAGYTMNREHVWPKSRASFYQKNGGSDLHHLRPSVSSLNGAKSNHRFGNVNGVYANCNVGTVGGTVCYWTYGSQDLFECKDDVKGDVARILLYVYCRWGQPNLYSTVDSDKLPSYDSDDSANSGEPVVESLQTLLEWCQSDPVDTWEMERNDLIQSVQGNRNVFIDYPELAWLMFGMQPPTDMTTPSGMAAGGTSTEHFTVTATSNHPAWGTVSPETQTCSGLAVVTATPTDESLYYAAGYQVTEGSATVTQAGNTFRVRPASDCTVQIVFAQRQRYEITFFANGAGYGNAVVSAGDALQLPTSAPEIDGWSFVGWTTDGDMADSAAAPATLLRPGAAFTPAEDTAFYAVYQQSTGTGSEPVTVYEQVADSYDVVEGTYVITWDDTLYLPSETAAAKNPAAGTGFTVAEGRLEGVTEEMKWTFTGDNQSGFRITHAAADGTVYHLAAYNYSQGLSVDTTGATAGRYYDWTVADNGSVGLGMNCSDGSSRVIWVYTNGAGATWRYYLSGGTGTLRLYRERNGEQMLYTYSIAPDTAPHAHDYQPVVTAPTCTKQGYTTYTCAVCGDSYVADETAALGHDWNEPTYEWAGDYGTVKATRTCRHDESHVETETAEVVTTTELPTCEEPGQAIYSAIFENPAFETQTKTVALSATGHSWGEPEYVWAEDYSTVTASRVCENDSSHVETETVKTTAEVTMEATHDAEGEITYTAVFENTAFATQTKAVATPKLEKPDDPKPENPFVDVQEGAYYSDAVLWAVSHDPQITNGTGATTFSPNATCTRAQVVTFLWRANGCPEAEVVSGQGSVVSTPFEDVSEDRYYYNAVLWAVENGITTGMDATHFGPDAPCTRAQVVTFLWRATGKPEPQTTDHPFTDVTGGYYYKAVLWAVENGITNGTSATTFGPGASCTRGQIVTFLYRDLAE